MEAIGKTGSKVDSEKANSVGGLTPRRKELEYMIGDQFRLAIIDARSSTRELCAQDEDCGLKATKPYVDDQGYEPFVTFECPVDLAQCGRFAALAAASAESNIQEIEERIKNAIVPTD